MKLYYTPNSPYARIARIAIFEAGIGSTVRMVLARNREDDNPVLDVNPVGRVPTLVAEGLVLTEALHVVNFIAMQTGRQDIASAQPGDWETVAQEGQILGFLEAIAFRVREGRRGDMQSQDLILVEVKRCQRCLEYLNAEASKGKLPSFPAFRSLALASALELMDMHDFSPNWKNTYPDVSNWFSLISSRASMKETRPQV